ncbi:hypothetical protein BO85DRAFT_26272 [Aspergillus piperis CBS 112811]|uniref:Uncharacterized protein n=1 Tax=Aspergillus piperis CBS 112811 TaxID=1448313 RepID=A0A8G1VT34_9EURO|nr:hypothetical protein BO85DRAFT_26272 [Aspergillus piperis CBS 112811]RAH63590.1 hypothetical protein BO85DRAFT_26272 [Aspergillus piperis CBS 112811]
MLSIFRTSTTYSSVAPCMYNLLLRTSSTMDKQIRITSYAQFRLARPTPLSLSSAHLQTLNRVEPRIKIVSGEFQPVLRAHTKQVRDPTRAFYTCEINISHHCGVTARKCSVNRAKGATAILANLLPCKAARLAESVLPPLQVMISGTRPLCGHRKCCVIRGNTNIEPRQKAPLDLSTEISE